MTPGMRSRVPTRSSQRITPIGVGISSFHGFTLSGTGALAARRQRSSFGCAPLTGWAAPLPCPRLSWISRSDMRWKLVRRASRLRRKLLTGGQRPRSSMRRLPIHWPSRHGWSARPQLPKPTTRQKFGLKVAKDLTRLGRGQRLRQALPTIRSKAKLNLAIPAVLGRLPQTADHRGSRSWIATWRLSWLQVGRRLHQVQRPGCFGSPCSVYS